MLSVIMLSVIMICVTFELLLNIIMLSVVMLIVMAPLKITLRTLDPQIASLPPPPSNGAVYSTPYFLLN